MYAVSGYSYNCVRCFLKIAVQIFIFYGVICCCVMVINKRTDFHNRECRENGFKNSISIKSDRTGEREVGKMSWYIGGESEYLNDQQMEGNAVEIYNFFNMRGWSLNAIAALIGNMERESTLNPALIEVGGTGHGLVQWTPPQDLYDVLDVLYGDHDNWQSPVRQMGVIYAEFEESTGIADRGIEPQWYKTSNWQYSWDEWAISNDTPEDLASAFCFEYLRPGVVEEEERRANARKWYEYLGGIEPLQRTKSKWIYYLRSE